MGITVGGWIFYIILALGFIGGGFCIGFIVDSNVNSWKGVFIGTFIGVFLCIPTFGIFHWYYNSTASGARAVKTQESNFNKGIERKVTVYDMEGDVIKEYEGKFDVDYDDDRIIFDDENNLRHIIYYPTGTVIIDEVGE